MQLESHDESAFPVRHPGLGLLWPLAGAEETQQQGIKAAKVDKWRSSAQLYLIRALGGHLAKYREHTSAGMMIKVPLEEDNTLSIKSVK